jgi:acetyl esterase/lipase
VGRVSDPSGPKELVRKVPKAWIGVMEVDILTPDHEGVEYGMKLEKEGEEVKTVVFKGYIIVAIQSKIAQLLARTSD